MKNKSDILGLVQLPITVAIWLFTRPDFSTGWGMLLAPLAVSAWVLSGDRPRGLNLLNRFAALGLLLGGTLDAMSLFPDRTVAFWIFLPVLAWFAGALFKRQYSSLAYLIIYAGLCAAPFTELHLERNPWTLTAILFACGEWIPSNWKKMPWSSLFPVMILLVWVVWTAIGIPYSVYPYVVLRFAGILATDWVVLVLAVMLFQHREQRRWMMGFLLTLAGLYALFAFGTGIDRIVHLGLRRGLGFRIFVFQRHPNYVIYPLTLLFPLWLLWLDQSSARRQRLAAGFGMILSAAYLLIFSYARGSWIILAMYTLLGLLLLKREYSGKFLGILTGCFFSGGVVLIFMFQTMAYRVLTMFNLATSPRYKAWTVFWELASTRPWMGFGMGTNRYIYPVGLGEIFPLESPTRQFLMEAHNAYIDVLTGSGFIGLTLFILFLAMVALPVLRCRTQQQKIFTLMATGMVLDLVFNFRLHAQDTGTLLILLCALIITTVNDARERKSVAIPGWLLGFAVVGVTAFAALPWLGKYYVSKAQSQLSTGNWKHIEGLFQTASKIEPLNAHPHFYLALCALEQKDDARAETEYQTAVNLNRNFAFYRYELANFLFSRGRLKEARIQADRAVELEPYDLEGKYRFLAGLINWNLGLKEEGEEDFWVALIKNPSLGNHPFWNDQFPLMRGILKELINYMNYYSEKKFGFESKIPYMQNVTDLLEKYGDPTWLKYDFELGLENNPYNSTIIIESANYFMRLQEWNEAEKILKTALKRFPDNSQMMNQLGYLYFTLGNYPKAQKYLEAGVENWNHLSLDDVQGYQLLAKIYQIQKDDEKLADVSEKLAYLTGQRFENQKKDLSIHIGDDYLKLQLPDIELK